SKVPTESREEPPIEVVNADGPGVEHQHDPVSGNEDSQAVVVPNVEKPMAPVGSLPEDLKRMELANLFDAKEHRNVNEFLDAWVESLSLVGDEVGPIEGMVNHDSLGFSAADHSLMAEIDTIIAPSDSGHASTSTGPSVEDDDDTEEDTDL